MTLHSRLNDELDIPLGYLYSRSFNNGSAHNPKDPTEDITEAKTHIAQDLLALIGGEEPYSTGDNRLAETYKSRNSLRAELRTKIRQYCGIREGSDEKID